MLLDSPATFSNQLRLLALAAAVIFMVYVLVNRLYVVQEVEGAKYENIIENQTRTSQTLSPARGSIVDRNGTPLAENRASYDIDIRLKELVGHYRRSSSGKLPMTQIRVGSGETRRLVKQPDIVKIVRESSAPLVENLGLKLTFDDNELRRHFYQKPNIPFQLATGLDFETLSRFTEHGINVPGIQEYARPVRVYPYGALAPHILGYIGQLEEETDSDYVPESEGKEGIERSFDTYLQGKPGRRILRKTTGGFILGVEGEEAPTSGHTVYLSIDARIQYIAEQAMRKVGRGAAVVMDPRTGDVLAMVSVPSFDPNSFVPKVPWETWQRLQVDPTKPMLNRTIQTYPSGSIYKTLVALAALGNDDIDFTPRTIIYSPAAIEFSGRWWSDWYKEGRGNINLEVALQWSCNTFFYKLGVMTGIDSIVTMGDKFGLGEELLTLEDGTRYLRGEHGGTLPGPDWMKQRNKRIFDSWRKRLSRWQEEKRKNPNYDKPRPKRPQITYERWSHGHTYNTSIGQGYVQVTPLQMTTMICAVANGGDVFYPRLIQGITTVEDNKVKVVREFGPRHKGRLSISPADMQAVRKGLRSVVTGGTGRRAGVKDIEVAGKTGSAQFMTTIDGRRVKDTKAWFNGFAPYENPRYAITVLVEGGKGGGTSAGPIVKDIFEGIFEMENGQPPDMRYLTPAIGHFKGITDIVEDDTVEEVGATPPVLEPGGEEGDVILRRRDRGRRGLLDSYDDDDDDDDDFDD